MKRRTFLWSTVAAGGSIGIGPLVAARTATDQVVAVAQSLGNADTRAVGRVYLTDVPGENDRDRLVALIAADLATPSAVAGAKDVEEQLLRRVRSDYDEGRTVDVSGWILSRTEARFYGLTVHVAPDSKGEAP